MRAAVSCLLLLGVGGCNYFEQPDETWCRNAGDFGIILRAIGPDALTPSEAARLIAFRPRLRQGADYLSIIGHEDSDLAEEWLDAVRKLEKARSAKDHELAWAELRASVTSIEDYPFTQACLGVPFNP